MKIIGSFEQPAMLNNFTITMPAYDWPLQSQTAQLITVD